MVFALAQGGKLYFPKQTRSNSFVPHRQRQKWENHPFRVHFGVVLTINLWMRNTSSAVGFERLERTVQIKRKVVVEMVVGPGSMYVVADGKCYKNL